MTGIIIGVIVVIIVLYFIMSYNKLKKLNINVERSFADLDVFLMKRVDQLDNLIQTARVATDKEMETLENVTGLRQGIAKAYDINGKVNAHMELERQLPTIMASFERYPDIKFNENYLHIQRSINEIEEQIQAARRNFNSHTSKFNTAIATFPRNMIAGIFKFTEKTMFEAPEENRRNVDVKALFNR